MQRTGKPGRSTPRPLPANLPFVTLPRSRDIPRDYSTVGPAILWFSFSRTAAAAAETFAVGYF